VQLEDVSLLLPGDVMVCFNSILVQLEAVYQPGYADVFDEFQFHIGAIRRRLRLRTAIGGGIVSIPYWCN